MESALHQRDHIGVQDAVLLENYESEDAFLENLQKRFRANLIYVRELYIQILTLFYCVAAYTCAVHFATKVFCFIRGNGYPIRLGG